MPVHTGPHTYATAFLLILIHRRHTHSSVGWLLSYTIAIATATATATTARQTFSLKTMKFYSQIMQCECLYLWEYNIRITYVNKKFLNLFFPLLAAVACLRRMPHAMALHTGLYRLMIRVLIISFVPRHKRNLGCKFRTLEYAGCHLKSNAERAMCLNYQNQRHRQKAITIFL